MSDKPRLLVLNPTCLDVIDLHRASIESHGVELLAEQSYRTASQSEILQALRRADAVILPAAIRNLPLAEHMAACPQLRVCSIAASGFEWLDVAAATREGIVVCFAPGGLGAQVVAEMALALMLAVARQIPYHNQQLCRGDATRGMGTSLFGKTLGIIGLGSIGRELALCAKSFRLRIVACEPQPDRRFVVQHGVELLSLEELLRQADFVSLHVRLNEETRHMIGAPELRLMKPTAYLINAARQELVDEEALAGAILSGQIAGAALDDPPGPAAKKLLGRSNVIFTPHLGNRAIEGVNAVFRAAWEAAIQVLRGQRPTFVVNPQVYDRGLRSPPAEDLEALKSDENC
jgi:phosphoglycerate dehydrogenase-like enzyme